MNDNPEILRLRVLLCLLREGEQNTVSGIAKTLEEKHYTISRILTALENEKLVVHREPRKPQLTVSGRKLAKRYAERIDITISHLLYEGVNLESAKNDAYFWALYNTDETMEVIRSAEEKCRVKYELRNSTEFSGKELCQRLNDGEYRLPFIIYRETAKKGNNISMANEGFEHPCILSVKNGIGTVLLKVVDIEETSAATGLKMRGHIKSLKYFKKGDNVNADRNGNILSFPAEVLKFKNVGDGMGQILHGLVCLRMQCSVGAIHMPESTAIFTILM